MAVSYTWDCKTVETYPTHSDSQNPVNSKNDVIFNVHYSLIGTETVNEVAYSNSVIGSTAIDITDLSSFTSLDSVTNAEVKNWVTASLEANSPGSVAAMKKSIKDNIVEQQTPTTEIKYLAS